MRVINVTRTNISIVTDRHHTVCLRTNKMGAGTKKETGVTTEITRKIIINGRGHVTRRRGERKG